MTEVWRPGDRAAGAREALLALAAEIEALNDWPKLESISDEAYQYARGTIQGIANMARQRAQIGQTAATGPAPVSRESQGGTEPLSASLSDEAAERLARAAYAAYTGLRTEQMQDGRVYPDWDDLDLLERFAWEVAAVAAAEAERERLYAVLGNDHYVIFTGDGWTTEHSIECRLSGRMSECEWHEAIRQAADVMVPDLLGRWRITGISEGLPDLERAERGDS